MWNELGIPNHLASVAMPKETSVGALPLVLVKQTPSSPPTSCQIPARDSATPGQELLPDNF